MHISAWNPKVNVSNSRLPLNFKGSVERSLLPSVIFVIFTRSRSWKSKNTSARCFSLTYQRKDSKKSERTLWLSWRPWVFAYIRDRPYNFSCLSAMSKMAVFAGFFSALGCHLAMKGLSWPAMQVSNRKGEFEQRKRIKLFDDFWMRAPRFDFAPGRQPWARSMKTLNFLAFNFRHVGQINGLASSVFIFGPILCFLLMAMYVINES